MTKSKSIYKQFYNKLIIATSLFVITLSFIFYEYARSTVYDDIQDNMLIQAKQIIASYNSTQTFEIVKNDNISIDLIKNSILKEY